MTHPSFGKYTKEEIETMMNGSWGSRATKEGMSMTDIQTDEEKTTKLRRWVVEVSRAYTAYEYSEVEVEAETEEEAKEIVLNDYDTNSFDWEEDDYGDKDCDSHFEIESVGLA